MRGRTGASTRPLLAFGGWHGPRGATLRIVHRVRHGKGAGAIGRSSSPTKEPPRGIAARRSLPLPCRETGSPGTAHSGQPSRSPAGRDVAAGATERPSRETFPNTERQDCVPIAALGALGGTSMTVDYDFDDPRRIDRILELLGEAWRRFPVFRLGQFLEIVAETHELGLIQDYELERRLKDPSTWQGPPPVDPSRQVPDDIPGS